VPNYDYDDYSEDYHDQNQYNYGEGYTENSFDFNNFDNIPCDPDIHTEGKACTDDESIHEPIQNDVCSILSPHQENHSLQYQGFLQHSAAHINHGSSYQIPEIQVQHYPNYSTQQLQHQQHHDMDKDYFPTYCGNVTDPSPRDFLDLFNGYAAKRNWDDKLKKSKLFLARQGNGKPFEWKRRKESYFCDAGLPWHIMESLFLFDLEPIIDFNCSLPASTSGNKEHNSNSDHPTTSATPCLDLPALDFTMDIIGTNTGNTGTNASAVSNQVDEEQTHSTPQPVDNTNTYTIPSPELPEVNVNITNIKVQSFITIPVDEYEKLLTFYESSFKKSNLTDGGRNTPSK